MTKYEEQIIDVLSDRPYCLIIMTSCYHHSTNKNEKTLKVYKDKLTYDEALELEKSTDWFFEVCQPSTMGYIAHCRNINIPL